MLSTYYKITFLVTKTLCEEQMKENESYSEVRT